MPAITPQSRAIKNYRSRIRKQGLVRFEVLAPNADRDLIRSLAKRLTQNDSEASRIRTKLRQAMGDSQPAKGGILAALRRSPLVGADLTITRSKETGRKVEL